MKKRHLKKVVLVGIFIVAVFAAVCVFLFTGRKSAVVEISLERLSDGTEYKFEELDWGISAAEAAKLLPYDLEEDAYRNEYEGIGGTTFYVAENSFALDGQQATATFEFQDDALAIVQYSFRLDEAPDYEQWFESLVGEVLGLYGDASRSLESDGGPFRSRGYSWETDSTMLQIILTTGDSRNPSALIGVARKP